MYYVVTYSVYMYIQSYDSNVLGSGKNLRIPAIDHHSY